MNQSEKLALLAQCDFSWWREQDRPEYVGKKWGEVMGIGNAVHGLYGGIDNVVDGVRPQSSMEVVDIAYQFISDCYARIPFERMDRSDIDFRFLFEYREGLERLGEKLHKFKARFEADGRVERDFPEFREVMQELENLKGRNYRRDILRKHGIDLSEPAPLPE